MINTMECVHESKLNQNIEIHRIVLRRSTINNPFLPHRSSLQTQAFLSSSKAIVKGFQINSASLRLGPLSVVFKDRIQAYDRLVLELSLHPYSIHESVSPSLCQPSGKEWKFSDFLLFFFETLRAMEGLILI